MDLLDLKKRQTYNKSDLCSKWGLESQVHFAVVLGANSIALFLNKKHERWSNEFRASLLKMQYQANPTTAHDTKRNRRVREAKLVGEEILFFWREGNAGDFTFYGKAELQVDHSDVGLFSFRID